MFSVIQLENLNTMLLSEDHEILVWFNGEVMMCKQEEKSNLDQDMTSHVPLLLAIMVTASVWIAIYTDYFPLFGSVLGLGGILVVVPALQGLMRKSRQEAYARYFDDMLFQNIWSARLYIGILLFIVIIGFGVFQPVRIENPADFPPLAGTYSIGAEKVPFRLAAGGTTSFPIRQPFVGGPREIRLATTGLPTFTMDIGAFQWPKIAPAQQAWGEPVVVLRPDAEGSSMLTRRQPLLVLTHQRPNEVGPTICRTGERWLGRPLWLGGGSNLLLPPEALRQSWLAEDSVARRRAGNEGDGLGLVTVGYSKRPICQDNMQFPHYLMAGDKVGYRLEDQAGNQIAEGTYPVQTVAIYPVELIVGGE